MAQAAVSKPAMPKPSAPQFNRVTWVQLGNGVVNTSKLPSLLGVPENCIYAACPIVVVSHPRGQTPERLYQSTSFKVLADALLKANYAVLLSGDGGPSTWGSPQAFKQVVSAHQQASQLFHWNKRTYALGLSMGGLMALRSALPSSPYALSGLALIDAWTNLKAASRASRRGEIEVAYTSKALPDDVQPQLAHRHRLPMFVAASPDDQVVPWQLNSEQIFQYAEHHYSEFVTLRGPHLGGNRFSPKMADQLVNFFDGLELRAKLLEGAELPL